MTEHAARRYHVASFLQSASKLSQLPEDTGYEVAFVGRSNAGKSSALNTLTGQNKLAKTSKQPGRTQLINLFSLDASRRIVDLPGYGYAKVAQAISERWQETLTEYLNERKCLRGLILVMDIRHIDKPIDHDILRWAHESALPAHVLLTKADKLSKHLQNQAKQKLSHALKKQGMTVDVQVFSSLKRLGVETLCEKLDSWYAWGDA